MPNNYIVSVTPIKTKRQFYMWTLNSISILWWQLWAWEPKISLKRLCFFCSFFKYFLQKRNSAFTICFFATYSLLFVSFCNSNVSCPQILEIGDLAGSKKKGWVVRNHVLNGKIAEIFGVIHMYYITIIRTARKVRNTLYTAKS